MSTNYIPAVQIDNVSVGQVGSNVTVGTVPVISSPLLIADIGKVSISGISYRITNDASGQRIYAGVAFPGSVPLAELQKALSYSTWITPSNNFMMTASFVYASGTQQSINININNLTRLQPRTSVGSQIGIIAANMLSLKAPARLSDVFVDASAVSVSLTNAVASMVKTQIESATTQDAMLRAIIDANGPVLQNTASGVYTMILDSNTPDLNIGVNISNVKLFRTLYGKSNFLDMKTSIPVSLRITSLIPDLHYDVDSISNFTSGQVLSTWTNLGRFGTAYDLQGGGVIMRLDASGRRYLETVAGSKYVASQMNAQIVLDRASNVDGEVTYTLSMVFMSSPTPYPSYIEMFDNTGLNYFSIINDNGVIRVKLTNLSSGPFVFNLDNQPLVLVVQIISSDGQVTVKLLTDTSSHAPQTTSTGFSLPSPLYVNLGRIRFGNMSGYLKSFRFYQGEMGTQEIKDHMALLKQQYFS